jgi:hypothetical protein
VAKLYGYWIIKEYREAYNMFCCSGILFNHESERRGETFVTRKITLAAARIAQGKQEKLFLGNLSSLRDWGYAKDYVECMWLILQHDKPEDFVIATGVQHSVREFAYYAFKAASKQFDTGLPMDEVLMDYVENELGGVIGKEYAEPQGRITQGFLFEDVTDSSKFFFEPVYWAYNHGSNDYSIIKKYVDMAATLHLPYVLIDAEWDQMNQLASNEGKTIEDAIACDETFSVLMGDMVEPRREFITKNAKFVENLDI